jgi:aspartate aminotransferase
VNVPLSNRVQRIRPSPTVNMTAVAAKLRAEGRDVIALSAGEPDFDTPEHIKAAAVEALERGDTKYTPIDGTLALKQAVQAKFRRENGLDYTLDQILVSSGAMQSCYNACQAVLNPGDEVVIPAPYWVSYPEMVKMALGKPVAIKTTFANNYKLTPAQLEKAITKKTKALILCSPSNPTGACYTLNDLKDLALLLLKHPDILIF